jgi:hypothetical protein
MCGATVLVHFPFTLFDSCPQMGFYHERVPREPKMLFFLATLPFLPRTKALLLPYLLFGTVLCLFVHSIWPHRMLVRALTPVEWLLVLSTFVLGGLFVGATLGACEDSIYSVEYISEVPVVELQCVAPCKHFI